MKFLQHSYTSSKIGQGGGAGFQTYSLSKGIKEIENQELERNSMYIRPSNKITDPTEEELDKLFPKSFSFFSLSSGRYGISLAQYRGTDYSGRSGNFFTHTLICEAKSLQFYPIQMYQNRHLKSRLTAGEESLQGKPELLPALHLELETPYITKKRVETFLQENERMTVLEKMVQAVFSCKKQGRRILILDEQEHIPLWFAAITMSFPVNFFHEFSFTTYTFDPIKSESFLNGTLLDGTNYRGNETMIGHQFYVFNLFNQDFPTIEGQAIYASFVLKKMASGWKSVQDFFNFIEKTNLTMLDDQLNSALILYTFLYENKLDSEQMKKALQFAQTYCGENLKKEIIMAFRSNYRLNTESFQALILDINVEVAEDLAELLFEVGYRTDEQEILDYAFKFFIGSFNQMIIDTNNLKSQQRALSYFHKVKAMSHPPGTFSQAVLMDSDIEDIHLFLNAEPDKDKIHMYTEIILEQLQELGEPWKNLKKPKKTLVQLINLTLQYHQEIIDVERLVKQYPEYLGNALLWLYSMLEKYHPYIESVLFKSIQRGELPLQMVLQSSHGRQLLDRLFESVLATSNEPADSFILLSRNLFQETKPNGEKLLLVVKRILELKEESDMMKQAEKLLASRYVSNMEISLLKQLNKVIEKKLPLNEEYAEYSDLVGNIEKFKKEKSSLTTLFDFGKRLPKLQRIINPTLEEIAGLLVDVTERQYTEYLLWVLPSFVKQKKIEKVMEFFVTPERLPSLWSVFKQLELSLKRDEKTEFLSHYLVVYLNASNEREEDSLRQDLISYCKANKSIFKKSAETVMESAKSKGLNKSWKAMESEVLKSESIFKKVLSPFSRHTRK